MTGDTQITESKIFDHYKRQLSDRTIDKTRVDRYLPPAIELQNCINDIKNRLSIRLKAAGVCTSFLIQQLGLHRCQFGEAFGTKVEYYNSSEILDLIELIEEGKVAVADSPFNHRPLKGLFKVHHGAYSGLGYSLLLNVSKYWFKKTGVLREERKMDFKTIIDNVGKNNFSAIANQMHTKATSDKNVKLTGEWLIVYQWRGKNYFLCLATHEEGDQVIFDQKIKKCIEEFPTELSEICG